MGTTRFLDDDIVRLYDEADPKELAATLFWGDELEEVDPAPVFVIWRSVWNEQKRDYDLVPRRVVPHPKKRLSFRDGPLLKLRFVDVGQGDGAILETPSGQLVVIDGGEGPWFRRYFRVAFAHLLKDGPAVDAQRLLGRRRNEGPYDRRPQDRLHDQAFRLHEPSGRSSLLLRDLMDREREIPPSRTGKSQPREVQVIDASDSANVERAAQLIGDNCQVFDTPRCDWTRTAESRVFPADRDDWQSLTNWPIRVLPSTARPCCIRKETCKSPGRTQSVADLGQTGAWG